MTVITASELERMRASVRPKTITDYEAKRRHLKDLSDSKVKKWPNTLQATRAKKENWKKERLEREEEARLKIDAEEAELQHAARSEAIRRANEIMYESRDKMKFLRSQQQYSDVVVERSEQVKERAVMEQWAKEKDLAYHAEVMRQISVGEERDQREAAARIFKARAIAASQTEQLAEFRGNYVERLKAERREGELVQEKALADQDEEERIVRERRFKAKLQLKEMEIANAQLQKLKFEDTLREEAADSKRKAELERKEYVTTERLRLEKVRFESRQATKQRLIDAATRELETRISDDHRRLEDQVEAQLRKEEDQAAKKAANAEKQKRAIDISRQQQLDQRHIEKAREEKEIDTLVAAWHRKSAEIDAEEAADEDLLRQKNADLRDYLKKQIAADAKRNADSDQERLAFDHAQREAIEDDDRRFRQIANEVIDKAKADGKPTYMLYKARDAKDITVLPTMGTRL